MFEIEIFINPSLIFILQLTTPSFVGKIMAPKWPLYLANLLFPLAILLFASGFFPYKPFIPGLATFSEENNDIQSSAPFDRVIFMVVDALRR